MLKMKERRMEELSLAQQWKRRRKRKSGKKHAHTRSERGEDETMKRRGEDEGERNDVNEKSMT